MRVVTPHKFITRLSRSIERLGDNGDHVRFRIEDTVEGQVMYASLDKDERESLIALLSGGDLKVKPKFSKGDIVRFYPKKSPGESGEASYSAQQDALAVVTSDYDGSDRWVQVKWICTRGKYQMDGGYPPECFEFVSKSHLSDLDHRAILNRVLDKTI